MFILYIFVPLTLLFFNNFYQSLSMYASAMSVFLGVFCALLFGNPYIEKTNKFVTKLLPMSIIGLGFGMNLSVVIQTGLSGFGLTFASISLTLIMGIILGKLFLNEKKISLLISFGTAICGGSAIAALAPSLKAKHHDIAIALAVVFILNACALFIFPPLGHYFSLSQDQFATWSALAIHDTSSVVGANLSYGEHALNLATTIKLTRALWIIPFLFLISFIFHKKVNGKKIENQTKTKIKYPWFILWFLCAAACVTWFPVLQKPGIVIRHISEQMLILVLFFIGASLTKSSLKQIALGSFLQGLLLWVIVSITSFIFVYKFLA